MLSEDSSAQPRRGLCVCLVNGLLMVGGDGSGVAWVVVYFSMDKVLKKSISRLSPHSRHANILTIFFINF